MKLLKVGERFINFDQVIDVQINRAGDVLLTTVPQSNQATGILLKGEEKAAVLRWLAMNADDAFSFVEEPPDERLDDTLARSAPR